jgi:hypothetical protein
MDNSQKADCTAAGTALNAAQHARSGGSAHRRAGGGHHGL